MSAAVKEQEKADPVSNWRMPEVAIGDTVLWYPDCDKNSTPPSMGRVIYVSSRSIELHIEGRDKVTRARDVRHIADPQVRDNDNLRAFGGWDYTSLHGKVQQLIARVRQLEDKLAK